MSFSVRRVRAGEGERVRELRLRAVSDPAAAMAFLTTYDQEIARDPAFWDERAASGASGDAGAMFIAETADAWIGSATVLVRRTGDLDHTGHRLRTDHAGIVGVFVDPAHRGAGVIDALLDAAADWTAQRGFDTVGLDVHVDNARAQGAYRRAGFVATGEEFTTSIGRERAMTRSLRAR